MNILQTQAAAFIAARETTVVEAQQRATLQILCGLDMDQIGEQDTAQRKAALNRIRRALRVERIKGQQRHWSYDLNRHIALKQALQRYERQS